MPALPLSGHRAASGMYTWTHGHMGHMGTWMQGLAACSRLSSVLGARACQSVSQSLPHSYQRSTWSTIHSIFLSAAESRD